MLLLSSDHFALLLLDICIVSWMLRNWLAGLQQPYLVFVLILVLRLVSVAVLWLLCLLLATLLLCSSACCWLRSSACCWLCSSRFFSSFLSFSTLSAALRAHCRFDVLHAVLVPVLLYFVLLATGPLGVVLCRIFTTCSLAVVPSVLFSPLALWLWLCL